MPKLRVESFTISLDGFGAAWLGPGHENLSKARVWKCQRARRCGCDPTVLRERLIDEMHIAIAPVLLGAGERLFDGINLPALGYACTRHVSAALATHVIFSRQ